MSLLNDALKAAEQRQGKPAPSAYLGGNGAATTGKRAPLRLLLILVTLLAMAVAAWHYLWPAVGSNGERDVGDSQPAQPEGSPDSPGGPVNEESVPAVEVAAVEPEDSRTTGEPLTEAATRQPPEPVPTEDNVMDEPREQSVAVNQADQEQATDTSQADEPARVADADKDQAQSREPEPEAAPEEPVAASDIKQARQSPEQRDRELAKRIKAQLAQGDITVAEQSLQEITAGQAAPASRYAFARGVLARGDVGRALTWAPADLAARYPELRLIRARAQLAGGDLDLAVATLQRAVPAVKDQVEYRVTLATLLQQQGQSDQAANHWAELIAWDSGRAPWWVGLAIALEGRGDTSGATRAYRQAAALPGLAPSLADYVRQRLQQLGAG